MLRNINSVQKTTDEVGTLIDPSGDQDKVVPKLVRLDLIKCIGNLWRQDKVPHPREETLDGVVSGA